MTLTSFKASLTQPSPPTALTPPLQALWHEARGEWHRAHETVQELDTPAAAWVHGYLHRKEGDAGNARYWYRRAGQPDARVPLDVEWEAIVAALLADGNDA